MAAEHADELREVSPEIVAIMHRQIARHRTVFDRLAE
jgi:hypothetical protein